MAYQSQSQSSTSAVSQYEDSQQQSQHALIHFLKPVCVKHKRQIQFVCFNTKCPGKTILNNAKNAYIAKRSAVCCLFCYRQHTLHIQDVSQISQLCNTIPINITYISQIFNKKVVVMNSNVESSKLGIQEAIDQRIDSAQLNCLKILKRQNFKKIKSLHSKQCQQRSCDIQSSKFNQEYEQGQGQHQCFEQIQTRLERVSQVYKTIKYFSQLKESKLLVLKLKWSSKKGLQKFQQKQNWLRGYLQDVQRERIHKDIQFLRSRITPSVKVQQQSFQAQLRITLESYTQTIKRFGRKNKENRRVTNRY